jgi:hypothetical protein
MSGLNLQCNGQPVQLHDVINRLNIEDRILIGANIQTSLDKDLETILEKTKRCARCYICKKHYFKAAYDNMVVLLTANRTCGHVFHASCVADKLAANNCCPVCNLSPVFVCNLIIDN